MEKWLEVDLGKLRQNTEALMGFFKVPVMAVIKQNAYGLGASTVGRYLEHLGISFFAVTNIEEGIELRNAGVTSSIVIFAPLLDSRADLDCLGEYDLIPAVYSAEEADRINRYALELDKSIEVHIKVDTGMGRMGFLPNELLASAGTLKEMKGLDFKGIFTHYSNAFEKEMNYTKLQLDRFLEVIKKLGESGLTIPLKYSANSMAALKFPNTHLDMVSIGSAFLGNSIINPAVRLARVYRCRVKVLQVRTIEKGSYIGYSNTYKTAKKTRLAVIPIGYTDGFGVQKKTDTFRFRDYLREQYNLLRVFLRTPPTVFFNGKPLKVIGKTSLQLTVIDIGDLPIKAGDAVDVEINPLFANARMARTYVGDEEFTGNLALQETASGKDCE